MHLQAILHSTDFCKTLLFYYLSTSKHYWVKALITVAFSFILCHFFLVGTVEDIYLFRSILLFCVQHWMSPVIWKVSKESVPCLQGGPSAPRGHAELCGCHSPLLWDIPGGVTPRLMESAGEGGARVAVPGPLLWEVFQCSLVTSSVLLLAVFPRDPQPLFLRHLEG